MTLTILAAPEQPILDASDAVLRQHLRLMPDETDQDELITAYCAVALGRIRTETRRFIGLHQIKLTLDRFAFRGRMIHLQTDPISEVTEVRYGGGSDDMTVLAQDVYHIDRSLEPANLRPTFGSIWPVISDQDHSIEIEMTVGYESIAEIPPQLAQAARLLVAQMYGDREAMGADGDVLPTSVKSQMAPYRIYL
jgi:uncharacterized phiE125 gp8 family phage protein